MTGKYKVITLCGSTRFKDQFLEAQKRLSLEGNIVISVGLFGHSGDDEVWTEGTKEMLDDMHKRKIDMADGIFVINVGGYIGSSTRSEIEYAISIGKTVEYLEDSPSGKQYRISDELIRGFYRTSIFGKNIDVYSLAYRDFCRTLRLNDNSAKCKEDAQKKISDWVTSLGEITSQKDYDCRHSAICNAIIDIYRQAGIDFHYGQAQKWVNMAAKYLCILEDKGACKCIPFLHVPVDNIIISAAEELGISISTPHGWSQLGEKDYFGFQNSLRACIKDEYPIEWEFKTWNK